MVVRLDQVNGIKADMHTWFWEAAAPEYKKLSPIYRQLGDVKDTKEIKGGFWKGTSAVGATSLEKTVPGQQYHEDRPIQGFEVFGTIKKVTLKVQVEEEFMRDWWRTSDFIRDYVKKNWPEAVENSKEELVAEMYNDGGKTAGADIFDNDEARIPVTTYSTSNLCYDGKAWFVLSGDDRTAKNGSTYFNGYSYSDVDYTTAAAMWKRLVASNNKKENGNPFRNSDDVIVVTYPGLGLDWDAALNSTLYPDDANNKLNPMKGKIKQVIENEKFTTSNFSCMQRRGLGLKIWFSTPKFNFWIKNDPETYWASVVMYYALAVQNFRMVVGNNAATA